MPHRFGPFERAAAIALSSRVDPITGGLVCRIILWTCRTFGNSSGDCDLHRPEILSAQRTLAEALARIEVALFMLSDEDSCTIGECYRVRADIHAMEGDLAAARAGFARAYAVGWDAEPGHAVLLFEAGDAEGALAALDRALQGTSWFHLQRRGVLLANAARIAALSGRADRAAALLAEVGATPDRWRQPSVRALILETRAALLAPGDPQATRLRILARQVWTGARIEYHAARVRLDLARAALAAGDETGRGRRDRRRGAVGRARASA